MQSFSWLICLPNLHNSSKYSHFYIFDSPYMCILHAKKLNAKSLEQVAWLIDELQLGLSHTLYVKACLRLQVLNHNVIWERTPNWQTQ